MRRQIKSSAFVAIGAVLALPATAAQASLYCELVATSDGFAAVRDQPSRSARVAYKAKSDELVQLDATRDPPGYAKDWVAVVVVTGPLNRAVARGWLHKSLIKPDSCG